VWKAPFEDALAAVRSVDTDVPFGQIAGPYPGAPRSHSKIDANRDLAAGDCSTRKALRRKNRRAVRFLRPAAHRNQCAADRGPRITALPTP